jgi:acetyl esterase/lipase
MVQVPTADEDALARHLDAIHTATGAGLVVQDYPASSGVRIAAPTLARVVARTAGVVAVKAESTPTAPAVAALTAGCDAPVFGGLGGVALIDELSAGAAGAMTGFSFPEGLVATVDAFEAGGIDAARDVWARWMPLAIFEQQEGLALGIRKEVLRRRGVIDDAYARPPATPFPAALDDAVACYAELLARGIPPRYIVVAGDSAGGGLAAALGVALVQRGLPQPAGYALLSPEVDLTLGGASITDNAATDILPPNIPTAGYVGDADPTNPLVSPLFADADVLAQLAPMLIQIGGREMLRDGQRAFAAKVAAAGIPVWLHEEPDMFHVWPILLTRRVESKQVGSRVGAFIEQLLGPLPLVAEPGLITPGLDETNQQRATAVRSASQLHTDDAERRELFGYDLW